MEFGCESVADIHASNFTLFAACNFDWCCIGIFLCGGGVWLNSKLFPQIYRLLLYGILLTNARAMGEFGAVSVVSGNIGGETQSLPLFIEDAYKQYQTEAAFSAAVILAMLALVTLVLKEILEHKSGHTTSKVS